MKHGNFFTVQNQIFDFALSPVCFVVYCYLCKCRNKKYGCYPSKRTIANACGVAVSSVSKAIKQLASSGLIVVTANYSGGRQINNSYRLTDLSVPQTDAPIGHGGISPVSQMDGSKQEE